MGDSTFASGFKTGFGSAFLQFALERFATFGSFARKEIGLIWGVEDELRKLQRTFLKIQDLVDHMEGSPLRFFGGSKAWQMWFEDLKKLAYEADALLDHVSLHLTSYCANHSIEASQESQVFPMIISSLSELDLPHKICEMQSKLEELGKEMESLVMIETMKSESDKICPVSSTLLSNFHSAAEFVDGETVVGRERDQECVVNMLTEDCLRGNFSVIPIVGMAGIGKATLARLAYDEDRTGNRFKRRMWVSISMGCDVVRITKSIIESATLCACNLSYLNSFQVTLQGILHERKFLLVLDDYWSEKYDDWETLCSPFRFGPKGSKIIVITRSTKVSSIVGSREPYKLELLSENDGWRLIK